jgi:DNA-binding NarL/FixJ family response regulator
MTMRILVADDHEVVRHGVRALLEARPGWQVVAEAVDGREAVEKSKRLQPDVIILDIGMPGLNGLDAARQILKAAPKSGILILTMHESEQVVREVLAAGARGYVLKSDAGRDLVNAVEAVGRQRIFFTSSVAQVVLKRSLGRPSDGEPVPAEPVSLTHREREVVQLLGEGKSNKEVADILGISVRTAETHRSNIMHKLECGSLSDLVRYAIRNHIITV